MKGREQKAKDLPPKAKHLCLVSKKSKQQPPSPVCVTCLGQPVSDAREDDQGPTASQPGNVILAVNPFPAHAPWHVLAAGT